MGELESVFGLLLGLLGIGGIRGKVVRDLKLICPITWLHSCRTMNHSGPGMPAIPRTASTVPPPHQSGRQGHTQKYGLVQWSPAAKHN